MTFASIILPASQVCTLLLKQKSVEHAGTPVISTLGRWRQEGFQDDPWLQNKFKANLGYMKICLKSRGAKDVVQWVDCMPSMHKALDPLHKPVMGVQSGGAGQKDRSSRPSSTS